MKLIRTLLYCFEKNVLFLFLLNFDELDHPTISFDMRSTYTLEYENATSVYIVYLSVRPYSLKVQPKRVQVHQSM